MANTRAAKKRATYLAAMLETGDKRRSCRIAGLGPNAPARIKKLLDETGGIEDRPRSGRPIVYTPTILENCYKVLVEQEPQCKWTTSTLFENLKSKGLVHENAERRCFYKRLLKWGREKNVYIQLGSTKEVFMLQEEDKPKRLDFSKSLLEDFNKEPRLQSIFIDEICLEFGPHPKKGKRWSCACVHSALGRARARCTAHELQYK